MHLYVKHATLINNCYPEREDGGSRSSELSYLTFYASSRPIKLTKVGVFLERKVERDMLKGRRNHNVVSLEILQSLIHACHRDLNLFSNHIVKILLMVLGMKDKDSELINKACETFVVFSKYHDGNTLGIDGEYTDDYETLIQEFASYCTFQNSDETLAFRMQLIGHYGLQACVASPALHSPNIKTQLGIILPPVIAALGTSNQPTDLVVKSKKVPDIKHLSLDDDVLDGTAVCLLAAKTASLLFGKIDGAGIRLALGSLLCYLDSQQKWWPPNFVVASTDLILESVQVQYRYLLVPEIIQQLEDTTKETDWGKQASLVSVLDTLLNAGLPLTGISVLEVLSSLFGLLIKSLRGGQEFKMDKPSSFEGDQATFEYVVHQGLAHSIAGLAAHTYYQNQSDDITTYILAKLRTGTTLDQVEGIPLVKYRNVVLRCLDLIVGDDTDDSNDSSNPESPHNSDDVTSSPASNATISLETWVPAFGILLDSEPRTRVSFAMILVRYLDATTPLEMNVDPFPKHTLTRHGDIMFFNGLQQHLLQWSLLDDFNIKDVQALYLVLCALTRRLGVDGTIRMIPLVFQLQTLAVQWDQGHSAKQRALTTAIVEYFEMVGQLYHVDQLVHYVNQVRTMRLRSKEYSTVGFCTSTSSITAAFDRCSFGDLGLENHSPVTIFLDRHTVVGLFVKDSPLRDEDDTFGLDLERKLSVEWGSEAYASQERSCRIRTSRNLDQVKPKLATPWANTNFAGQEADCQSGEPERSIGLTGVRTRHVTQRWFGQVIYTGIV
ncbi:hypothetical protein [Absidia glauca]|uniref:Uncharacterized protein n=1 Tax=Absidia glauca TaxID=4829 RepID=A0A168N832_ABSGL|nr:hypothetical protein [Absidia glauca]